MPNILRASRAEMIEEGDLQGAGIVQISQLRDKKTAFQALPRSEYERDQTWRCYALVKDGRIIYLGRSVKARARLVVHNCRKDQKNFKDFDSVFVLTMETEADAIWWESALIDAIRPEYNLGWGNIMIKRRVVEMAVRVIIAACDGDEVAGLLERGMQ